MQAKNTTNKTVSAGRRENLTKSRRENRRKVLRSAKLEEKRCGKDATGLLH